MQKKNTDRCKIKLDKDACHLNKKRYCGFRCFYNMSSIKVGNLLVFLPFRSFLYFSLSFDISCWSTPHSSLGDSRSFLAVWESEQDTYSLASRTLSLSISMCRKMDKHRLNRKEPDRKFIIFIQRPLNTSLIPTSVSNLKHEMKFIQKKNKPCMIKNERKKEMFGWHCLPIQ